MNIKRKKRAGKRKRGKFLASRYFPFILTISPDAANLANLLFTICELSYLRKICRSLTPCGCSLVKDNILILNEVAVMPKTASVYANEASEYIIKINKSASNF